MSDLDRIRSTPLDKIRADEVVRALLKRGAAETPVEVARFGSSI